MVLLPEPDSPISASTSPLFRLKSAPCTIGTSIPSSLWAATRRPLTLTISFISLLRLALGSPAEAVDEQIDPHGQGGDGDRRCQHGRGTRPKALDVFPHH